jgi:hypothetical protein
MKSKCHEFVLAFEVAESDLRDSGGGEAPKQGKRSTARVHDAQGGIEHRVFDFDDRSEPFQLRLNDN